MGLDRYVVFDLDGTLIDSDEALLRPFDALGIGRERVSFGLPVAEECARHGITTAEYESRYDHDLAPPFPGVVDMLRDLDRWAILSNKGRRNATAELSRLGWSPSDAMFTEDFNGPKRLQPLLERLGWDAREVLYVGDTAHDRLVAADAGAAFGIALWNPRARAETGDIMFRDPAAVVSQLSRRR